MLARSVGPGPAKRCSRAARTSRIALRNCSRNSLASARSDSHSRRSRADAESGGSDERHMTDSGKAGASRDSYSHELSPLLRSGAAEERIAAKFRNGSDSGGLKATPSAHEGHLV